MAIKLKLTLIKSSIGRKQAHRRTLRALGFHRLNETVLKDDNPAVRGMIHSVNDMLKIEEVEA